MKSLTRNIVYAFAAIPASYLPLAYICMVGCVFASMFMDVKTTPPESSFLWWGWQITFYTLYATLIQWPFYLGWAITSTELSIRQRAAWTIVIFLFNMLAMPYFLWCKYTGTSRQGLFWLFGKSRLKQYLAS